MLLPLYLTRPPERNQNRRALPRHGSKPRYSAASGLDERSACREDSVEPRAFVGQCSGRALPKSSHPHAASPAARRMRILHRRFREELTMCDPDLTHRSPHRPLHRSRNCPAAGSHVDASTSAESRSRASETSRHRMSFPPSTGTSMPRCDPSPNSVP